MEPEKKRADEDLPLRLSANADRNIDEITGYIAFIQHQPLNAIKVGDGIFQVIEKIASNPWKFKECVQLPTKTHIYRQAIFKSWHIIYKIKPAEIIILGVIRASRKPSLIKALRKIK